jgi:transcriptional regulator with XRE-family HTH domain
MDIPLFAYLKRKYKLWTDSELAAFLNTSPSSISRVRTGKKYLNAETVLFIHEKTGIPTKEIRKMQDENYDGRYSLGIGRGDAEGERGRG